MEYTYKINKLLRSSVSNLRVESGEKFYLYL